MTDIRDFIQQVKQANDIVDVIGSYLELRHSGTNYFARCPFHGEKTGSFCVNRNRQMYHCFGCGVSGDVVKFVKEYESCTYMEAVEILAKRAGLKMPETRYDKQDKEYAERKRKRDLYMQICRDTAVFYYKNYYASNGKIARDYMQKRGFDETTVKKFGIGYSPSRDGLVQYLHQKGYHDADMLACGVVQKRSADGTIYDALSRRLIVPIFNMQGKVIAFGGRGLDERTIQIAKYKNTSETPIFRKNENLFAINLVKEEKQQGPLPNVVIVEGYMDVIAMYQAGFRRAVASMGTSLTQNQAKWISRLTDTVYICYDGDSAGQKATVRGLDILDQEGLNVKVMSVPNNLDPDEYIKEYGAQAFEQLIEQALSLADYKLYLLEREFPINSTDMSVRNDAMPRYVRGALKMLKQLDDVRQNQYISIVSLKTGYSQDYLRRKLQEDNAEETTVEEVANEKTSPQTQAKYFVAASLLAGESYATLSEKPQCDSLFLSNLYDYVFDCYAKGEKPTMDMLYTVCPDATQEEYAQIIGVDFSKARQEKNATYFAECVTIIELEKLNEQQTQLLADYKKNPENVEILQQIAVINKKINDRKKGVK